MEKQSNEQRGLEAYFSGGQGPPRAVAPSGGRAFKIINYVVISADHFSFEVSSQQIVTQV